MQDFRIFYKNKKRLYRFTLQLFTALFLCTAFITTNAQKCPPNIDFETGTFAGWKCYTGSVFENGKNEISLFPSVPVPDRHTMLSANPGDGRDPYGRFPVNCPNGSGHSIKLGNNKGGGEAEGIAYEFTIPANKNVYSLIYHYAVVFEDPNHKEYQQPRLELEITNVTDNSIINCSSFTFIPNGSRLPGFFLSLNPRDTTPVWCKDWSAVSINLDGYAGKTIRLFFKTADCTFTRHFGYAYIDVNSECSGELVGATYCPDDTAVNIVAPYGYQDYRWYNNTFTQFLGRDQVLTFKPPPVVGTTAAVVVMPYNGYGCQDTFYARFADTLTVTANAGLDTLSCNFDPVLIGANSKPGLVYSWRPSAGLNNSEISNPLANPDITTEYILTVKHDGGGCIDTDTVVVRASIINDTLQLSGNAMFCLGSGDSAVLHVQSTNSIQWFKDNIAINGASQKDLRVNKTGAYHAVLLNNAGCMISTAKQNIIIDKPTAGINYPVQYAMINSPFTLQARKFGSAVLWTPGTGLDDRTSYTPVFRGSSDQTFIIEIKTASNCITLDTQVVKSIRNVKLYVPAAFTPNNDGLNDFLYPLLMGINELRYFSVYNRWGQLLFHTKTKGAGWDGKLNGIPQATQVVVWIAEGFGLDGKIYTEKGTSTLIR